MFKYLLAPLLVLLLIRPVQVQAQSSAAYLFEHYQYAKSLEAYLKMANGSNPKVSTIEGVADCYRMLNNSDQAEQWYGRLSTMQGAKPIDIYYYAEALLKNNKPLDAKKQFTRYFDNNGTADLLSYKLASCDSAAAWIKRPGTYKVTDEQKMNTSNSDWGVSYAGKTSLVFTSDRPSETVTIRKVKSDDTGIAWMRMYNYDLTNKFTDEVQFEKFGKLYLNKSYHTGPMAINANGDTAYITINTPRKKGDLPTTRTNSGDQVRTRNLELIRAIKKGDKWGSFTTFQWDKPSLYSVGHATLSKNGQFMYFASDMPGGFGKSDIWYCEKTSDGAWSRPVNCGAAINTADEEAFPFIADNGQLYFSSRGLPGMGGLDIFTAKGSAGQWGNPVNLKYPLNSSGDDFGLITRDGLTGYLSSDRKGNDDIYSFTNNPKVDIPKKPENRIAAATPVPSAEEVSSTPKILPPGTLNVEGSIFDADTNLGLDSVTVYLKSTKGETLNSTIVPAGKIFSFRVNRGTEYILEGHKKGYYPATQYINANGQPANFKMHIEHLAIGKTFIIRNIYYDLNRANIRKDAEVEMDRLVTLMKENPTLKIELSSHTDSRGSDYYNMLLSQARAVSAVAYMKRHGIAADRMIAKGYGETRLLNKCANGVNCSEEEHQLNRRTEIKVIGGNFNK